MVSEQRIKYYHLCVPVTCTKQRFYLFSYGVQSAPGGYKHQFINNPPDRLLCLFCKLPVRDAYQHNSHGCGQLFCSTCFMSQVKGGVKACPACQNLFSSTNTVQDIRADNEIKHLQAKCSSWSNGCRWMGDLMRADEHIQECLFLIVPCTNICGETMQRRFLNNHLMRTCSRRSHQCPHCKLQGEYCTIMGSEHLDRCPDLKITCTICDKDVKRRMMEVHKRACQIEPVPCQYQHVGCSARPRRQDIPQHNLEAMGNHLQLAISFIAKQRQEIAQKDQEIAHKDDKIKQQCQEIAQKDKKIAEHQCQKIKQESEKEQHKKIDQQIQQTAQHHTQIGQQYYKTIIQPKQKK